MKVFTQSPPQLGNQYLDDRVLRSYLHRRLPPEILAEIAPVLEDLGRRSGGELYQMQLADQLNEPRLTRWDAWGNRIDQIELSPLWQTAERLAAEFGIVAAAYDTPYAQHARVVQFALAYLFHPSTDVYTCPLAMTDGAARTLLLSENRDLIDRAVPHFTSRNPAEFWTSGQWMTETTGGSDVGTSEAVALPGADGTWRLYGRKWFTSATTSQTALTLARPEGNPPGGRGLALFYVETRDASGRPNHLQVNRLKDKLGTRKVPTAELTLDGLPAVPVYGLNNGVRNIVPMLHLTRTWNSVTAVAFQRRGLALTRDYAARRVAFGAPLAEQPLHIETLADLQAEFEAAFYLSFLLVELIGLDESGEADDAQRSLLRLLTSIAKLTTARQAVGAASEVLESFGGAGYVEDTGIPVLLRDSQVLPVWEGTTNVLALDVLRALRDEATLPALEGRLTICARYVQHPELSTAVATAQAAAVHARQWLQEAQAQGQPALEAGARRFALTLGRALALALLAEHAQWALDHEADPRPLAAAQRFARSAIDHITGYELQPASQRAADLLANDHLVAPSASPPAG